jgi:hypothetical protein
MHHMLVYECSDVFALESSGSPLPNTELYVGQKGLITGAVILYPRDSHLEHLGNIMTVQ